MSDQRPALVGNHCTPWPYLAEPLQKCAGPGGHPLYRSRRSRSQGNRSLGKHHGAQLGCGSILLWVGSSHGPGETGLGGEQNCITRILLTPQAPSRSSPLNLPSRPGGICSTLGQRRAEAMCQCTHPQLMATINKYIHIYNFFFFFSL